MTHGGKRKGAGRPTVIPKDQRVDLRVTVHQDHADALDRWAEDHGHVNVSNALREILGRLDELP